MTAPARRKPVSRLTPEQRSMQARLAAQTRWANKTAEERAEATRPAREARDAMWDAAPNPAAARAAFFTRIQLAASRARTGT